MSRNLCFLWFWTLAYGYWRGAVNTTEAYIVASNSFSDCKDTYKPYPNQLGSNSNFFLDG